MTSWAGVRAGRKTAPRDRTIIDGVDVTYWRMTRPGDQPITHQGYALKEPFAYGPATLVIPRINPQVEQIGVGAHDGTSADRSWIRTGALVRFERVWYSGTTVTARTIDYLGVVAAVNIRGGELSLDIQGDLEGRMAMIDRQPPVFRRVKDCGDWVYSSIINTAHQHFPDLLGPTTGIRLADAGQMTELAWLEYLCSMSQTVTGAQRTLMPTTWGSREWAFNFKDTTTKHFTLFNDGARVSLEVADDAAEQPNVWFGSGQANDGERWRNAKAPGITAGDPPAYPMTPTSTNMTVGLTDAGTNNGSGVSTLVARLIEMGYLDLVDNPVQSTYGSAVADAVKQLQADAHHTVTGSLTLSDWNALFNIAVTGYSLAYARQDPLVQDPKIPYWTTSANGSYISHNPAFDRFALRVDRTVDFGSGITKSQGVKWARGAYARAAGKNWAGTIRLNGFSGYSGEHDGTTQPSASLVMPLRDIRPGMNAWVPYFDGGTLFHVAGVQIDSDGNGATLTVDTQARDMLELAQIIQRNRDSRRDLRREWAATNRRRGHSGNMPTFDEIGGRLTFDKALTGGKWTVVPIPVGQVGQVNRLTLQTSASAAAFAVAVFATKVTRQQLANRIGNPLVTLGDTDVPWNEDTSKLGDWLDSRWLLYAAGSGKQPCGYWPRPHTSDAGVTTTAPITGKWQDDDPWPYICAPDEPSIVYLAVYADRDCTLNKGRIMWKQEDDAI